MELLLSVGRLAVSGLTKLAEMGFWDYIVWPFGWLFRMCYLIVPTFSLAVLLFAIIFKVALFPLDIRRQRSMAKSYRFQPKVNAIQQKYANDKQKMNEELQKLYNEEGYNPMGGCLSSMLPLPIFFALYKVITHPLTYLAQVSSELIAQAQDVLTTQLPDLKFTTYTVELYIHRYYASHPEWFDFLPASVGDLNISLFGLDLTLGVGQEGAAWYYWIFPILTVLASILSAFIMGQITKKNNAGMQGSNAASNPLMVFALPLFTGIITYKFPSGVLLYWIYNSLLMLLVNLVLNKFWPLKKLAAQYEEKLDKMRAQGKKTTKNSAFREKLLEAQKANLEKEQAIKDYDEAKAARKRELERRMIAKAREEEAELADDTAHRPDNEARKKYLEMQAKQAKKNKKKSK